MDYHFCGLYLYRRPFSLCRISLTIDEQRCGRRGFSSVSVCCGSLRIRLRSFGPLPSAHDRLFLWKPFFHGLVGLCAYGAFAFWAAGVCGFPLINISI